MGKLSEGLIGLERELLLTLLNGTETTLLLLETENHPDIIRVVPLPPGGYAEGDIRQALDRLAGQGLVASRAQHLGFSESGTGIPELELGREDVIWWGLTESGRSAAAECLAERDSG